MIIGPLARKLWKKRYSDTATSGHPYRSKPVELSGSSKRSSGGDPERNKNNVYFCKDGTKVTASDSTEHIVDSNMSTVGSVIQTETTFQVSSAERGLHSLPPYSVHVGS